MIISKKNIEKINSHEYRHVRPDEYSFASRELINNTTSSFFHDIPRAVVSINDPLMFGGRLFGYWDVTIKQLG